MSGTTHIDLAGALRRYKPYAAYKDSGVEWLGEIPAHWEVKKLSWLTECMDRKRVPLNAEQRGQIQGEYPYWGANSIVDYIDTWLFDEELVLLGEDGAPFFDPSKPVAFRVVGKVWVNNHSHVLRPRRAVDARFLTSALNSVDYQAFIDGTTRDKLTQGDMNGIPIQLPSLTEQNSIATFLDRETARIDALVAKKERLIALLQEQRTALITRAVTKGLDPTVPMKDSGVEWMGIIPAHWEVKQLRQAIGTLMDFRGRTPTKLGMDWGGAIPAISAVNVREDYLDLARGVNYASQELHDRWMTQGPTRRGDVLFTTEAPLGNVALVPDNNHYILSQRVVLLRPYSAELMPEYLHRLLACSAFRQGVEVMATGSTAEGVKRRYLMAIAVCLPRREEQRAIAALIDQETTRIDALVAKIHDAIDRLKELRTALISAAVTGKIDVRDRERIEGDTA